MKVKITTGSFDDSSRGRYGIKTYHGVIELDGFPIFSRDFQECIAYSPGYLDRGQQVRDKADAKTHLLEAFSNALREAGVK